MMKARFQALTVLLAVLPLAACIDRIDAAKSSGQLQVEGAHLIADAELRDALIEYYSAESRSNWQTTYEMRSSSYKELVPFEAYREGMETGMDGWDLEKVEILNYVPKSTETSIKIRFHERFDTSVADSLYEGRVPKGLMRRVETTVWGRAGGEWFAIDAGQRGHLPLNARMVYE